MRYGAAEIDASGFAGGEKTIRGEADRRQAAMVWVAAILRAPDIKAKWPRHPGLRGRRIRVTSRGSPGFRRSMQTAMSDYRRVDNSATIARSNWSCVWDRMVGRAAHSEVLRIGKDAEKAFPPIVVRGRKAILAPEDLRLSWGYTQFSDYFDVRFRAVREGGRAVKWARQYVKSQGPRLAKEHQIRLAVDVVGPARIAKPNLSLGRYPACAYSLQPVVRPGSSIGGPYGGAGSIGLVVVVTPEDGVPILAVTTAAHVAGLTDEMRGYNSYTSPSPGDSDEPQARHVLGPYHNGTLLSPISEETPTVARGNKSDLALIEIRDDLRGWRRIDKLNHVPVPVLNKWEIISDLSPITGVVAKRDIRKYVNQTVFKIGRTTAITSGKLLLANAGHVTIRMHDDKFYRYEDLSIVEFSGKREFSKAGDSGGLVYTQDLKAMGFVVGVENNNSLFFSLSVLFEKYGCRLYNPATDNF